MYNAERIIEFKKRTQDEISLLLRAKQVELSKIVQQELGDGDSIHLGMGSCVLENKLGEQLDNDFVDEITSLNYRNAFDSGFSGFTLPIVKDENTLVFTEIDHCWYVCDECEWCVSDNNSLYLKPEDREVSWSVCDKVGDTFGGHTYTSKDELIRVLEKVTKKKVIIE